ncbi:MAG: DJ-1/PfpI family protein [Anaerolinea sp.]|nr:DJ-1/PfpI family protein [Anaerolinea sp.]
MPRHVAILIFPDVEVLDFAGPFEIFSVARLEDGSQPFSVYTVAETTAPVAARNNLIVTPHHTIYECPPPDIVVIPGGRGTRALLQNESILTWIRQVDASAELTTSVCTGSLLLARAGLLDGLRATTHHSAFDELAAIPAAVEIVRDVRYVDNGRIITSAGVQAGMDMALHVIARLHGEAIARQTAAYIEYRWQP